jgi:hypothetical protein
MAASAGVGMKGRVCYKCSSFYYCHWIDTSAGGLLVPDDIILPLVSASAMTWFIRYTMYLLSTFTVPK